MRIDCQIAAITQARGKKLSPYMDRRRVLEEGFFGSSKKLKNISISDCWFRYFCDRI